MDSSTSQKLKVGAFVFIAVVFLVFTVFMIGGDKALFTSYYQLKVNFSEVTGLGPGSVVSLSGVPVGNVKSIDFTAGDKLIAVSLSIEDSFRGRITTSSTAEIKTQGALGDKFVYITQGAATDPPLTDGQSIPSAHSGDLLTILSNEGDSFREVFSIIHEVHRLVQSLNEGGRTTTIMENLKQTSTDLRNLVGESKLLVKDIRKDGDTAKDLSQSVRSLASVLKKIDNGNGSLGALINDPTLHNRLTKFLGGEPRQQYLKSLIRKSIQHTDGSKETP